MLQQAQAQLASAKANQLKAKADDDRQTSLPKMATTQQEIDAATAALAQADAQVMLAEAQVKENSPVPQHIGEADQHVGQLKGAVEQAKARLDQADLNLKWAVVTAPQDGWITKRNVEVGNYVTRGQQIFSIVSPDMWVTANFKENQLDLMRPGQPVKIHIDAYPELDLRGHVDSIQLRLGIEVHGLSAGERDRQFRQDRSARAGQDRHRPRPRSERPDAARHLGRSDGQRAMSGDAPGLEWKPRFNPWLIAVSVTLAAFMEILDTTIVNVALPHIAGTMSASSDEATWTLTSYLVANGIVLTISGWLSDMLGRKRYFLICLGMFTVCSFLCGIATASASSSSSACCRASSAAGCSLISSRSSSNSFPPAKRGAAFGVAAIATVVAPILGPTLGGIITDNATWRWIFFINVPVGIIAVFLNSILVEDPPWEKNKRSARHRLHRPLAHHHRPRLPANRDGSRRGRRLVRLALHRHHGGDRLSRHRRRDPVAAHRETADRQSRRLQGQELHRRVPDDRRHGRRFSTAAR